MMEAISFARGVRTPLTAHITIHWGGTAVGDDPDGRLSAKLREGLDKWLQRHGVPHGLTAVWVRERQLNRESGGHTHCTHFHMLLHLPDKKRRSTEWIGALELEVQSLLHRHGSGNVDPRTCKITFPPNPDGKYFLKGGTRAVWEAYRVPKHWHSRLGEGVIEGKRCGTTQNIGAAARRRWQEHHKDTLRFREG